MEPFKELFIMDQPGEVRSFIVAARVCCHWELYPLVYPCGAADEMLNMMSKM